MKVAVVAVLALAVPRVAGACADPIAAALEVLADQATPAAPTPGPESVVAPMAVAGGGGGIDGTTVSAAAGIGWGDHHLDGAFGDGAALQRAMIGVRHDRATATSLTYGWFDDEIVSAAFDLGAEVEVTGAHGLGPTARVTLGVRGIDVQLAASYLFAAQSHATVSVEMVVDIPDLAGTI